MNNENNNVETNQINNGSEAPKKNNLVIIIAVIVVLVAIVCGLIFMLGGSKENESGNNSNESNEGSSSVATQTEFLTIANKYVAAVEKLWTSDSMVCQDAKDSSLVVKPSELSATDKYEGDASYYVFINTADSTEMKLDVDNQKAVAGWVRIRKSDNSYYVALSDGTNYIIDTGTKMGTPFTSLTASDVVTTGNGSNYQYMNGEIFGSNTDGNGWGIGDYAISTDGDSTNDGIYMSNGKKTGGYTPYCSNAS